MKPQINYSLYLVTDSSLMSTDTMEDSVEQAIKGGCTLIQLREKNLSSLSFYNTAKKVKVITDHYNIPLIINDRIDIVLAVEAAGVHIGQNDLPAKIVKNMIGEDKILGVSASCLQEALQAQKDGADYLGVGAMFQTGTKTDAGMVSMEELKVIRQAVHLPIVVIGGINKKTIPLFSSTGIDGIAVVSAVIAKDDITLAATELKDLLLRNLSLPSRIIQQS